jgi:beta-lactamase regulating signal transducer with metallopeptidase domain
MIATTAEAVLSLSQSPELSLLGKATVLIGMGLLAARLAAQARASVRHLLLAATFAALLGLPLAAISAPEIVIGVPVSSIDTGTASDAVAAGRRATRTTPPTVDEEATAASALSVPWTALGRGAWAIGATLFLAQLALVLWRLRRLRRSGLPWPEMRDSIRSLAADAGVERDVEVVLHEDVLAPLTFGTRDPVIVLPTDARTWDEPNLRRALVHELEHVRRRDWVLQTAARAICSAWWFHPLVWIAWRRLSLEAERACDDAVIVKEEDMEYAEQLVSLAKRLSAAQAAPTLGMANRSDLSSRVSSLLDQTQPRGHAGVSAVAAAIAATSLMVLGIAPLRAVATPTASVPLPPNLGGSTITSAERAAAPRFGAGQQGRARRGLNRELYEAALDADLAGVSDLLDAGADVNGAIDGDGSPLIGGVRSGQAPVVTLLLDRGANPNLSVDGDGSPLIVAARLGRIDMVRLLISRGADPNVGVEGDGSPLIAASAASHTEVVTLLLDHGAQVDLVVPGDENALIQASGKGHLAVVQTLVRRGADVNARVWAQENQGAGEWRTPLNTARRGRHTDVVAFLLSAGARE